MKTQYHLGALLAFSLTACGNAETAAPANDEAKLVEAKIEPTPAAGGTELSKAFMTGKWAIESDGDCTLAQDFKADGSVDGMFDSWTLEGSNMVVKVEGETMTMALEFIDPKRVKAVVNGKTQNLIRC